MTNAEIDAEIARLQRLRIRHPVGTKLLLPVTVLEYDDDGDILVEYESCSGVTHTYPAPGALLPARITKPKYEVGDTVLVRVTIAKVDAGDPDVPYSDENGGWWIPDEVVGLA